MVQNCNITPALHNVIFQKPLTSVFVSNAIKVIYIKKKEEGRARKGREDSKSDHLPGQKLSGLAPGWSSNEISKPDDWLQQLRRWLWTVSTISLGACFYPSEFQLTGMWRVTRASLETLGIRFFSLDLANTPLFKFLSCSFQHFSSLLFKHRFILIGPFPSEWSLTAFLHLPHRVSER